MISSRRAPDPRTRTAVNVRYSVTKTYRGATLIAYLQSKMYSCPLCKSNFSDGVRCSKCTVTYCFGCANISEVNYRKLGSARQASILCSSCKTGHSQPTTMSPGVSPPSSTATLDLVLQELRSGISEINSRLEKLPAIVEDIKNVKQNLQHFEASIAGIKQEVITNSVKLAEVEERVRIVESESQNDAKYPQLQAEIVKLSNEIIAKDQMLRQNNIEIKGIPLKKNENLFELVGKLGDSIGQRIEKSDINFVTRARSATQPKPIIVGFLTRYKKQDFVASARSRKPGLTARDLGFADDTTKIYVNDHLTKDNKLLLSKTKKTAIEHNFKYVWVQNCKILTRRSDTSPILPINSESDLTKIK